MTRQRCATCQGELAPRRDFLVFVGETRNYPLHLDDEDQAICLPCAIRAEKRRAVPAITRAAS